MKQFNLKNGDSVVIREANVSDAKALLDYVNTISGESDFLTFGQGEFKMSVEQEEQFLDHTSRQNNAYYIVAEVGGKIVGTLSFSAGTRPRTVHIGEFGVSVLREYWGNGIGSVLIEQLIEWCRQSRVIRKINLIVKNDNFAAIHVYQKLGFQHEGVITRDLQIDGRFYDALFMGYAID